MKDPENYLKVENLWFGYKPGSWVLKDISLNVPKGSLSMLMGSSGSGKTTLLKVVGGFLPHQQGKIFFSGEEITNGKGKFLHTQIGYIPQQLGLVRNLSVLENVLIGSLRRTKGLGALIGIFPKKEVELARSILDQLGIGHKREEKLIHLSGGERQRVAIARTLMQKPSLILADEFVSDLDLKTAGEILQVIQKMGQKEGITFLMSMHEFQLVKELNGEVLIIKDGKVASHCRGSELEKCDLKDIMQ